MDRHRDRAVPLDTGQKSAFTRNSQRDDGIVQLCDFGRHVVAFSCLKCERALANGGKHDFLCNAFADPIIEAESLETRAREDDGVEPIAIDLADAGWDVSAQRNDLEVGARRQEQCCAPGAPGSNPRFLG